MKIIDSITMAYDKNEMTVQDLLKTTPSNIKQVIFRDNEDEEYGSPLSIAILLANGQADLLNEYVLKSVNLNVLSTVCILLDTTQL